MSKRLILAALAFCTTTLVLGQELGNLRKKRIALDSNTIVLDTLSIIPNSFNAFTSDGVPIDPSLYEVNFSRAVLTIKSELSKATPEILVEYRVFPMLFEREFYRRDYEKYLSPDSLMGREPPRYALGRTQEPIFGEQIQTNGSIMRGLRFGNNQNLSVNSSMNLTFSGELENELRIEGAISDQSVPIQPDGTTRRLEEFDRIYLKVYRENFSVQAGDVDLKAGGNGRLLTFNRSVQGLAYVGKFDSDKDTLTVQTAFAVPKGKFARNQIQGVEGNQGPYRLRGSNGEPFIMVISDSERIYVDGVLLVRGEDRHYTIDYNTAEVTFTHRMPINRNSRISIEFEYSERSYARFNTFASVQSMGNKWRWHISAFSEQDSRNQPFDQELTEEQKQHLASIGDNLSQAFFPQEQQVEFDPEKILYQKLDTLVNAETYSIFLQSTNPSLELYRVYFSFVGQGNGNYTPDFGTANGRVYRWVAPVNGTLQGSYEPIRRLVTPQKRQMFQAGIGRTWDNGTQVDVNYALSNNDLNTFSQLDSDDNIGHGLQLSLSRQIQLGEGNTTLKIGTDALKTTKGFQSIDRFRPVEFERDWSIGIPLNGSDEQLIGAWIEIAKPNKVFAKVVGEQFSVGKWFEGTRGSITGWSKSKLLSTSWSGSFVEATDTAVRAQFSKAKVSLSRTQGFINFNLQGELESSSPKSILTNSLLSQGFSWYQVRASAATPDTLNAQAEVSYTYREDYKPFEGLNELVGNSQEFAISSRFENQRAGRLTSSIGYRVFSPNTAVFTELENQERTVLSRFEYSNRILNNFWVFSGGYELGSGLEPDAEFYFVEVPAGQGVYTWVDYNGNGIMELDEFEIANFPDEARFIRINIPGSKMISVRNNALSFRSNINAAAIIKDKKGFVNHIGRLSNLTSYRVQQKNRFDNFWHSAYPIVENPYDTLITSLSANLRNSLAYNRASRKFGIEYIYSKGLNKTVLANGYEQKEVESHRVALWFGIGNNLTAKSEAEDFSNIANSQYFSFRNYTLYGKNAQQTLRFLSNKQHALEVGYRWGQSANWLNNEELKSQSIFCQIDLVYASKGTIMGKGSYVVNSFEGSPNSAVAYEMMKGLQPGKNITWELSVKRRVTMVLELELGYNGRYLNDGKTIHSGAMQARALF